MQPRVLNLHLVSDATGDTLNAVSRAALAQFEGAKVIHHRWSLIRTRLQLHRVVEGLESEPGPVLSTIVDHGLRMELENACARLGVEVVHVLDPTIQLLQTQLGAKAQARPGRQYVLDADYFRRIDAMHFVLAHDDGQSLGGINDADVVLVGVSRASKTPTSFYLANRGIKAANVPLVPGTPLPEVLDHIRVPVVGLTIDPGALIEIRRHRLRLIGGSRLQPEASEYTDHEAVKAELVLARRLCNQKGWPLIDVTRRSIEETAATVLQHMEAWHQRKERQRAAETPG